MCKFFNFAVTQILRRIKFGDSKSLKNADFAIQGALIVVNLVKTASKKSIFRAFKRVKVEYFRL